jgi:hypothetical protein
MKQQLTKGQLRSFGLIVGGIFGIIGIWPGVFRGANPHWWALSLAGLLVVPALFFPKILGPAYRVWMAIGQLLGWVNTRIILGALFYTLFLSMGFLLRLIGKDPMQRKVDPSAKTYRVPRTARAASHMQHQF